MKLFVSMPLNTDVTKSFVPPEVKNYLEERFEVTYSPLDRQLKAEEIAVYAKDADAIMTGWGHSKLDVAALENTAIK